MWVEEADEVGEKISHLTWRACIRVTVSIPRQQMSGGSGVMPLTTPTTVFVKVMGGLQPEALDGVAREGQPSVP